MSSPLSVCSDRAGAARAPRRPGRFSLSLWPLLCLRHYFDAPLTHLFIVFISSDCWIYVSTYYEHNLSYKYNKRLLISNIYKSFLDTFIRFAVSCDWNRTSTTLLEMKDRTQFKLDITVISISHNVLIPT